MKKSKIFCVVIVAVAFATVPIGVVASLTTTKVESDEAVIVTLSDGKNTMRINQALEAEKKLAAENPQSVPCLEEDEDFSVLDAKLAALDAEEAKLDARDLRALAVLARYGGKTYEELYISWDVEWERISAICDLLQTGKVTAEEETLLLQYLKRRQEWTSELDSIISGGTPFAKYQNPTLKKRLDDTLAAHKQVR